MSLMQCLAMAVLLVIVPSDSNGLLRVTKSAPRPNNSTSQRPWTSHWLTSARMVASEYPGGSNRYEIDQSLTVTSSFPALTDDETDQSAVLSASSSSSPFDVDETDSSSTLPGFMDPCDPRQCVAKFSHPYKKPLIIPCDAASDDISDSSKLPLIFPGDYTLCSSFAFAGAHYCTIRAYPVISIMFDPVTGFPIADQAFVLGDLVVGKCVPKRCTAAMLKAKFFRELPKTIKKLMKRTKQVHPAFGTRIFYETFWKAYLRNITTVECVKENEQGRGEHYESMGATLFLFLAGGLIVFAVLGTIYAQLLPKTQNKYMTSFCMYNSVDSLVRPMTGDYLFLNGVRVLSMMWVVYGHTVLFSTFALGIPIANPSAVDAQLQSFAMAIPRAAEYAVDTFFFMSGFLAIWGLLEAQHSGLMPRLSVKGYFGLIVVRYVRLTPVYAFVMIFYVKMLPFCGSGPYWATSSSKEVLEHSCRTFWSNFLYLNNLVPYGSDGGLGGCMPWTWYLANDFQYFMLAPFMAHFFLKQWEKTYANKAKPGVKDFLVWYAPVCFLILLQISMTILVMIKYDIQGTFDVNYSVQMYVKPWCRVSPYAIGCGLAMFRFDRARRPSAVVDEAFVDSTSITDDSERPLLEYAATQQRRRGSFCIRAVRAPSVYIHHIGAILAIGVMLSITVPLYDNFRCKASPSSDCKIWIGFIFYGEIAPGGGNWSHAQDTMYFGLTFAAWGFACAYLTHYAAEGHGGLIRNVLSHPVMTPLSRLTYGAYLVHIVCLQLFFARSTAPLIASQVRQWADAVAFIVLAFSVSFVLYVFVEKPFTSLLPWFLGFEKKSRMTRVDFQSRRDSEHGNGPMLLNRELSTVGDIDREVVIIGSPKRRPSSVDGAGGE